MFVPINTDAPLYHFPWATIGLIVVNTVCFVATGCAMNEERLEPWMLEYGNGINPLEWLTSMFAHGGWLHLIGNMFFLWGFGLVVEGKLGFRRFLTLYLIVGLLQGAAVDLLTLHRTDEYVLKNVLKVNNLDELKTQLVEEIGLREEDLDVEDWEQVSAEWIRLHKGRCLGASGAIFGILAISLVWAPRNEMHVVGTIGFRPVSFDVSILVYASFYLVLNVLGVVLSKGEMGSSGLHMLGALVGFAAGVLYLKRGWVDCENWDLFAVLSGRYGRFADENWALGAYQHTGKVYSEIPIPEGTDNPAGKERFERRDKSVSQASGTGLVEQQRRAGSGRLGPINSMIDSDDYIGASDALLQLRLADSRSQLDHVRLKRLALGLLQAGAADEAEICLEEYVERFPEDSVWAKLRLSHLLLQLRQRPHAAYRILKTMKAGELNEQQRSQARKMMGSAKKQIQQGVEDAEPEW